MNHIEVVLRADRKLEDLLVDKLYDYEIDGINIEDDNLVFEMAKNPTWEVIDLPEKQISDLIKLIVFFDIDEYEDFIRKELLEYIEEMNKKGNNIEIISEEILKNTDWATEWQKYYKILKIGEKIVIKPSWEDYTKEKDEIVIEMDPGMSFGTGTHATTSMCIEKLQEISIIDKNLLDIGCGSGILSIVAAKLGAEKICAIDIDPICIETTKRNAEINNCLEKIDIKNINLTDGLEGKFDIVVVNIIAEVIVDLLKDLSRFIKKDSKIILSGILKEKEKMVSKALEEYGYSVLETKDDSGWVCILSEKNNA